MGKYTTFRIKFSGPVHFGAPRLDYDISSNYLHSDTISAALIQAWSLIGRQDLIDRFIANVDNAISSGFPFIQSGDKFIYFLPKPFAPINSEIPDPFFAKHIKKLRWIDKDLLIRLFSESSDGIPASAIHDKYATTQPWPVDAQGNDIKTALSEVTPRVKVSRNLGEDAVPFQMDKQYFNDFAGLYFIIRADDDVEQAIKTGLEILKDQGFGTDRNVGMGHFDFECDHSFSWHTMEGAKHCMALSLFAPESKSQLQDMLAEEDFGYGLISRGGWITTHPFHQLQKKRLTVFKEGSIFRNVNLVGGAIHDVKPIEYLPEHMLPPHPVYRVGRALFLPLNLKI